MSDDYIKQIRKLIGHKPMLIPHAVVILFNEEGKVLFEVRADDGYLDFPGGSVDINEEVKETAKRELYEETGLIADELELFDVYSGPLTKYTYFNKDVIYGVDTFYVCKKYHGELKPQKEEVKELLFLDINDIKGKLSPRNKKVIEDIKARLL